jgi:hypothetical protein
MSGLYKSAAVKEHKASDFGTLLIQCFFKRMFTVSVEKAVHYIDDITLKLIFQRPLQKVQHFSISGRMFRPTRKTDL